MIGPAEALDALVADVIVAPAAAPFGAYLFGPDDPGAALGRHVEAQVFLEAFGNTEALLAEEYGAYDERSLFFVVIDHLRRRPAGMMRLITARDGAAAPTKLGLKSLDDLEGRFGEPPDVVLGRASGVFLPAHLWDIATLAVDGEYRSAAATGLVSLGLYQSVVRFSRGAGITRLVAILDEVVWRMTEARFAGPFVALAPPRPYLGSASSLPVYCDLDDWKLRLQSKDEALHRVIYEGRGIEPALRPLDVAAALRWLRRRPQRLAAARVTRSGRGRTVGDGSATPSDASTAGSTSGAVGRAK